jgi:aspartyl-tRNA(Asn)/glutamyl-tRNA(Gln) amidotransferase subunit A
VTALADVSAVRRALRDGSLGVVELVRAVLAEAEALQPAFGAFAELTPELALAQAEIAERELRAGRDRGPLHGLPFAVKDVIDVAGVPTRLGTPAAGHRHPARSAAVVDATVAAGAVVIGKATTHELAWGMVTPQSRNPFDRSRIVGGSSGGSAAAIAAGLGALALGTDTNGSVRCPAALCGVVGFKPAYDTLSRVGVAPLAWTQDTVGLLAPTVREAALAFAGIRAAEDDGEHGLAPSQRPRSGVDIAPTREGRLPKSRRLRIGIDLGACATAEPEVERACVEAVEALDADVVEVVPPDHRLAGSASAIALLAEASSAWAKVLDTDPHGLGPDVRAALRVGREVPAVAYLDAKRVRALIRRETRQLFDDRRLDVLALPTLPVTAAPAGSTRISVRGREQAVGAVHSRYASLASLTGQPALSVPCGLDAAGLPIGLQLLGRTGQEARLLAVGEAVERLDGAVAVATRRSGVP